MSKNIHGGERIVLATFGSYGDVHPYVALALASLWSARDPFVPPTAPWLGAVLRFGGPAVARAFMKLVAAAAVDLVVEKLRWTSFRVASARRLSAVA